MLYVCPVAELAKTKGKYKNVDLLTFFEFREGNKNSLNIVMPER